MGMEPQTEPRSYANLPPRMRRLPMWCCGRRWKEVEGRPNVQRSHEMGLRPNGGQYTSISMGFVQRRYGRRRNWICLKSRCATQLSLLLRLLRSLPCALEFPVKSPNSPGPGAEFFSLCSMKLTSIKEDLTRVAAIHTVPDDILRAISLHPDIHDHLGIEWDADAAVGEGPTPIAVVCSHWRALVLDTPAYWASLVIPITGGLGHLSLLRLFLQRSQGSPLSLVVSARAGRAMNTCIVDTIIREAPRWASLRLDGPVHETAFLSHIPQHLPLLESIELRGTGAALAPISAPRLHTLSLSHISAMHDIPSALPAYQITALHAFVELDLIAELLTCFPAVRTLTAGPPPFAFAPARPFLWAGSSLPTAPRACPSVRTLTLRAPAADGRKSTVMDALTVLNLPGLRSIEVVGCLQWDGISFHAHTLRSGCTRVLQVLVLRDTGIGARELLELLCVLPVLTTLEMTGAFQSAHSITDSVLVALTPALCTAEVVLPALTRLVLRGSYVFSTDALLKMLEARLDTESPWASLSTVDITLADRVVSWAELERFAALIAANGFISFECLAKNGEGVRVYNGHPSV
ncbi:hypothetical protein C8R46DRAFT_1286014, partial [Mycena filopes]